MECVAVAALFARARAVQLDQAARRPHARRRRRDRGGVLLARAERRARAPSSRSRPTSTTACATRRCPPLRLVAKGERVPSSAPARVMTNSFGFGGNNCTLVLGGGRVSARRTGARLGRLGARARGRARPGARWAGSPTPLARDGRARRAASCPRCCGGAARRSHASCCAQRSTLPERPHRAEVRTVFASRHGSINESIDLIETVARSQPISPAKFSHTVHNAQAGLFSIAAGNRQRVELARGAGRHLRVRLARGADPPRARARAPAPARHGRRSAGTDLRAARRRAGGELRP